MDKIRWGILSTAHINRRIIPAIRMSARGELTTVASRSSEKVNAYAAQWEIPVAYDSYEKMLADPTIDVIYISLPNHMHTEWILRSMEAGKHVLCEKPMCLSLEDLDIVTEYSNRSGKILMEAVMHIYHPQTELWKSIIRDGRIGDVHNVRGAFTFTFDRASDNYRWNADSGGGALWDVGVYPISLYQYLLDDVPASGLCTMYEENGIDLSTSALLQYHGGITGMFFVSFRSVYSTTTVIHGSTAQLHISHPYNNADLCQAYIQHSDHIENLNVPREYLYCGEVEAMHDAITGVRLPKFSLEDSRNVLATQLNLRTHKL